MTAYDESDKQDYDEGKQAFEEVSGSGQWARQKKEQQQDTENVVPILVPAAESDGEPVDICVNSAGHDGKDNDVAMHSHIASSSRQSRNLTPILSQPSAVAGPKAEESIWMTPARCMRTVVPGAQGKRVTFVPATNLATSQQATPLSPLSSASLSSPSRSSSLLVTPPGNASQPDVSTEAHPPLTAQDLIDALPHPNALFHPETMQWQVVLDETEWAALYRVPDPVRIVDEGPAPLWRLHDTIHAQSLDSAHAVLSVPQLEVGGSASAWEPVTQFDRWSSTRGDIVYSSVAWQLRSVIPSKLLASFKTERLANPRPGYTGLTQFQEAATTLIKIVGNAANGEGRALTASGKTISTKLGLDQHTDLIFIALGFQRNEQSDAAQQSTVKTIKPPDMSSSVWQLRMRRAWIELILWFDHERSKFRGGGINMSEVRSNVPFYPRQQNCEDLLADLFCFRPEQENLLLKQSASPNILIALESIGTDGGPTDELLEYCYRFNSAGRSMAEHVALFTALTIAVEAQRKESEVMQTAVAVERSKGLFTTQELVQAYLKVIAVEMDSFEATLKVDESLIVDMYRNAVKEAAADPAKVQPLKDALTLISLSRGRPTQIEDTLNSAITMDVDKAYEILEVQHDTDDDFITAAYQLAMTESRFSAEQCTGALRVIAVARKSDVLQKLVRRATGKDEDDSGWELADAKKPTGLNNIGNTCYLNSVLQYFYAIRPLRERVLEAGRNASDKALIDSRRLRVGGRKVTQREVDRSHKFVALLAQLFSAMMTSPLSAVTPERELAYLALVSSRVEESSEEMMINAERQDAIATTSTTAVAISLGASHISADTDTTFVDEPLPIATRLDEQPRTPHSPSSMMTPAIADEADEKHGDAEAVHSDLRQAQQAAPAVPARVQQVDHGAGVDAGLRQNSLMTLGAQQDVSECLDNVMFQVEAALTAQTVTAVDETPSQASTIAAAENDGNGDDEWIAEGGDLLRRLFLGRTIQHLEVEEGEKGRGPSIHTKRELFKILPVDVLEEGRDIYDGLDGFFDEEILTNTGGQPMRRTVTLTDAPAVMQIQLQRVQFDRVRGAFKSQAHLSMGETLFMDRYMDFDATTNADDHVRLDKRKQGRAARQQIAALRQRIGLLRSSSAPSADSTQTVSRSLNCTASFLASLNSTKSPLGDDVFRESDASEAATATPSSAGIPSELLDGALNAFLQAEAKNIDEEITRARSEIERLKAHVEQLWNDERRLEYVLSSVFMHRGEASHGHYFLNQRRLGLSSSMDGSTTPTSWFKYNDNVVQDISLSQVLKDTTGATPYLLSYVRKDLQDTLGLFDPVCRQIDVDGGGEPPHSQLTPSDIKMTDITPPPEEDVQQPVMDAAA